jgi:hypothetical protein
MPAPPVASMVAVEMLSAIVKVRGTAIASDALETTTITIAQANAPKLSDFRFDIFPTSKKDITKHRVSRWSSERLETHHQRRQTQSKKHLWPRWPEEGTSERKSLASQSQPLNRLWSVASMTDNLPRFPQFVKRKMQKKHKHLKIIS